MFNVSELSPFCRDEPDLRANPFQEEWNDVNNMKDQRNQDGEVRVLNGSMMRM